MRGPFMGHAHKLIAQRFWQKVGGLGAWQLAWELIDAPIALELGLHLQPTQAHWHAKKQWNRAQCWLAARREQGGRDGKRSKQKGLPRVLLRQSQASEQTICLPSPNLHL